MLKLQGYLSPYRRVSSDGEYTSLFSCGFTGHIIVCCYFNLLGFWLCV